MKKKNESESSSQLSIEYPRNFKIIHNKKTTFLVNPLVLSSVSELFREKYIKGQIPSLEVDDRLNDESFSVFFSLAHGQKVNLTLKIAYSILRIAKSWKSSVIQELVEKYLAEKPEVEVKIAETIDSFESLDLLPTANMFKGKSQLLKNMFQNDFIHSIPSKPLNALLEIAIDFKIDRSIINSFLIEHFKQNPNLKSDFLNTLDFSILTEEHIQFLLSDKRTKNNEKIKEASKHLSLQKGIPRVELSSTLMPKSKKSKPLKKSRMLSLTQVNKEGPRVIKMKEPYIGIFAKISYESNCEPFKNEFIRVSTTSHDPQNFLDPTNNDDFIITTNDNRFYLNQNEDNKEPPPFTYPYIIFQLPISVSITSYEVKNSFKQGVKEWTLYGSKNQKEWIMIDNQESDEIIEPRESVKIDLEEKSDSFSSFKIVSTRYYIEDDAYELIISSVEFFDNNDFSDGVLAKLKSEEKYVNVITSSNNPQLLISPRHKKVWYSANEQNQSVTFEFLKHKVQPTKYTLKSGAFWHPRSWQLSGSFDGKKWFILDKKTNAMQMDRKFVPNVWKIQQDYHICKFLRITQIGQTYDGMNILCLSGVEFFGNVESDESEGKRLKHNMEVFEELRSARGFRSPRSPRAGASAPASPITNKILPHIVSNDNKEKSGKKETEKKSHKEKKNSGDQQKEKDAKTKKKEETEKKKKDEEKKKKDETDKKKKEETEKKKKEEEKKKKEMEKKKKEEEKKKKDTEKKKKEDDNKKAKSKDKISTDSDSSFGTSDFTTSSETTKSSDTKGKSSKKSESVSTTDTGILSDTDDNKKQKNKKSKDKDSSDVSVDIDIDDFTSSSEKTKSSTSKDKSSKKSESISTTDVTITSETSSTSGNKKDSSTKDKSENSKDVSSVIEIDDLSSSSDSSKKSSDKKDKSSKNSESTSTIDITVTSETSDTSDNKKSKKSKSTNETSTDIEMDDFTSISEQTKSSNTKSKSKDTDSVATTDITVVSDESSDKDEKKSKKSSETSTSIKTDDFTSVSEQTKSSDTKDKSSKETESVSTTDITIISDKSSDTDEKKSKKSSETSNSIKTDDFTSASEPAKSNDTKDKSSKETESISLTDITTISEKSTDTEEKKSKDDKKDKSSKDSSAEIEIEDFTSDSKSSKKSSDDDKEKSSKESDTDVIVISDKSDTEDNKKSNDIVTDLDLNDFTSNSESSKSSDKPTKEKVKSDESSHSDSSDSDSDKKKEKSDDDKKKKKSSSDSSDIEAIFSDSDSSGSKKSKKSDDNDDLNKNIVVKSDEEILVISDASSDSNKNDDKKDSKTNEDTVEIVDDFTSDDPDAF